jgi:hypothetical protein
MQKTSVFSDFYRLRNKLALIRQEPPHLPMPFRREMWEVVPETTRSRFHGIRHPAILLEAFLVPGRANLA